MNSAPEMAERHGRVLTELAELGLGLARRLAAGAEAAQDDGAAEALAVAFHRVSRSVRLTLALESRLAAERRQGLREDRVLAARAVELRKHQVRAAVTRAVQAEREADDAERLLDELDERLDEDALFERFLAGPVEACIARIRADLGLPPESLLPSREKVACDSRPDEGALRTLPQHVGTGRLNRRAPPHPSASPPPSPARG